MTVSSLDGDEDHYRIEIVDEGVALDAGSGCEGGGAAGEPAVCELRRPEPVGFSCSGKICLPVPGTGRDNEVIFALGDRSDSLDADGFPFTMKVSGESGDDSIVTGPYGDEIEDGLGADQVETGGGNDRVIAVSAPDGPDVYELGDGSWERVDYSARTTPIHFTQDRKANDGAPGEGDEIVGANSIRGGSGDDEMTGGDDDEAFGGGPGDDRLTGNGGNDNLSGDAGRDTIDGGEGDDTLSGDGQAPSPLEALEGDFVGGGPGADTIYLGHGADFGTGGDGADTIIFGPGNDVGRGGAGSDVMGGGSGNDQLFGEADGDRISGDEGHDILSGEAGDDVLVSGYRDRGLLTGAVPSPLHSVDGRRDVADCGEGEDLAGVNRWDAVRLCESTVVVQMFEFRKPIRVARKGMALLPIDVKDAGRLVVFGHGIHKVRRVAKRRSAYAGTTDRPATRGALVAPVKAKGKIRRILRRRGRVWVKVKIRFLPEGGQARARVRRLRLIWPSGRLQAMTATRR